MDTVYLVVPVIVWWLKIRERELQTMTVSIYLCLVVLPDIHDRFLPFHHKSHKDWHCLQYFGSIVDLIFYEYHSIIAKHYCHMN